MWRTHPKITQQSPKALACKIIEKGWKHLSQPEREKTRDWLEELQVLLPEETGDAILRIHGQTRTHAANPVSMGKMALKTKIRDAFRKKRQEAAQSINQE